MQVTLVECGLMLISGICFLSISELLVYLVMQGIRRNLGTQTQKDKSDFLNLYLRYSKTWDLIYLVCWVAGGQLIILSISYWLQQPVLIVLGAVFLVRVFSAKSVNAMANERLEKEQERIAIDLASDS